MQNCKEKVENRHFFNNYVGKCVKKKKKKNMPEKLFSFFFKYTGGASATRQLPVDAAMEEM